MHLLHSSFWMSDRACSWAWYSRCGPITIDHIKQVRSALESDMAALAANESEYVALGNNGAKQCRAVRTGSVIRAKPMSASNDMVGRRVERDGAICIAKSRDYNHKSLFAENRVRVEPKAIDWSTCIHGHLARPRKGISIWKKAQYATQAVFWASFWCRFETFPESISCRIRDRIIVRAAIQWALTDGRRVENNRISPVDHNGSNGCIWLETTTVELGVDFCLVHSILCLPILRCKRIRNVEDIQITPDKT